MKRLPIIAGAAATVVLGGTLLAVPAIANNGSPAAASGTAATAPLTAAEKQAIDGFLADHPRLGHALAERAVAWDGFLKAHPDIAAEIAKVKALPAGERRAEVKKWLSSHPEARQAIRDWRSDLRNQRQDRRKARQSGAGAARTTSLSV
jgi:hemophore-related protein